MFCGFNRCFVSWYGKKFVVTVAKKVASAVAGFVAGFVAHKAIDFVGSIDFLLRKKKKKSR